MKRLFVLLGLLALPLVFINPAGATTATYAQKQISLNFTVTPSPTPVGYTPVQQTTTIAQTARAFRSALASRVIAYLTPTDPLDRVLAYEPIAIRDFSDVVAVNQGGLKVDFHVKADPKFGFFHIIPHTTSFNVGYGANAPIVCAYEVFAHYTTAWSVTDWVYGTDTKGGTPGLNGFPTYNYPQADQLAWEAEGVTSSFKAFANSGGPGELAFNGIAGSTKQVCFDLNITVPSNVNSGTYQTTIQYNLLVTF